MRNMIEEKHCLICAESTEHGGTCKNRMPAKNCPGFTLITCKYCDYFDEFDYTCDYSYRINRPDQEDTLTEKARRRVKCPYFKRVSNPPDKICSECKYYKGIDRNCGNNREVEAVTEICGYFTRTGEQTKCCESCKNNNSLSKQKMAGYFPVCKLNDSTECCNNETWRSWNQDVKQLPKCCINCKYDGTGWRYQPCSKCSGNDKFEPKTLVRTSKCNTCESKAAYDYNLPCCDCIDSNKYKERIEKGCWNCKYGYLHPTGTADGYACIDRAGDCGWKQKRYRNWELSDKPCESCDKCDLCSTLRNVHNNINTITPEKKCWTNEKACREKMKQDEQCKECMHASINSGPCNGKENWDNYCTAFSEMETCYYTGWHGGPERWHFDAIQVEDFIDDEVKTVVLDSTTHGTFKDDYTTLNEVEEVMDKKAQTNEMKEELKQEKRRRELFLESFYELRGLFKGRRIDITDDFKEFYSLTRKETKLLKNLKWVEGWTQDLSRVKLNGEEIIDFKFSMVNWKPIEDLLQRILDKYDDFIYLQTKRELCFYTDCFKPKKELICKNPECKFKNDKKAIFCSKCGTKL